MEKTSTPKTTVTKSSVMAAVKGDNEKIKTGVTKSSTSEAAKGNTSTTETITNIQPPDSIAAKTVSLNTPSVDIASNLRTETEKEIIDARSGKVKETPEERVRKALQTLASHESIAFQNNSAKNAFNTDAVIAVYKQ